MSWSLRPGRVPCAAKAVPLVSAAVQNDCDGPASWRAFCFQKPGSWLVDRRIRAMPGILRGPTLVLTRGQLRPGAAMQPRETERGAQLQRLRLLAARDVDRIVEAPLGL